jgi:hypothetical protein
VSHAPPSARGKLGFSAGFADWSTHPSTIERLCADLLREHMRPSGHCLYMQAMPIASGLPELAPLLPPWFRDDSRMFDEVTQLWMGAGGHRVAIHQDSTHGVLAMVSGTKDVVLFPPERQFDLYTVPQLELFKSPWRSPLDVTQAEHPQHPRFERALADALRLRLEPGDVLFIPAGWWHAVDSTGFNVMFNTRWCDVDAASMNQCTRAFVHGLLVARAQSEDEARKLRRRLDDEVFGQPIAAVSAEERADLQRRIAGTLAEVPGWDDELASHAAAELSLRRDGALVRVRGEPHGYLLPWSFLPLLSAFTTATTPRRALAELQREFDIDEMALLDHVRALTECGALARTDGASAGRWSADSALAHLRLTTAHLSQPLRTMLRTWLDIYGFRVHGDPYPGVALEDQGLFGEQPTSAMQRTLEAIAIAGIDACRSPAAKDAWTSSYALRDDVRCALVNRGARVASRAGSLVLPWDHLEVLSKFGAPQTPAAVYAMVRETFTMDEPSFAATITRWIDAGVLVDRGGAEPPVRQVTADTL